ncbi:hypothetical protein [Methylobacter tundripaludum]|uniref:hypothetical protein n=1 Tax=Methylobacter tundripaludum TaxID=173365 RepID=UPI00048029A6|nr:hypothetical protein [Methylobacter tundripaludum]
MKIDGPFKISLYEGNNTIINFQADYIMLEDKKIIKVHCLEIPYQKNKSLVGKKINIVKKGEQVIYSNVPILSVQGFVIAAQGR